MGSEDYINIASVCNHVFIEEIPDEWQRFDFFNEGILDTKPSSTGLTILQRDK